MRTHLFAAALVLAACSSLGAIGLQVPAPGERAGALATLQASAATEIPAAATSPVPTPVTIPTPPEAGTRVEEAEEPEEGDEAEETVRESDTPEPFENALQLFEAMNAARAAEGLQPLAWSAPLEGVALARANHLLQHGYFGHYGPDGTSAFTELRARGIDYQVAGENLARNNFPGDESPAAAFEALMASPSHRANILEPRFDSAGVAAVLDGDTWLYVTVFLG